MKKDGKYRFSLFFFREIRVIRRVQLRRGFLVEDIARDRVALRAVDVACQVVHLALVEVARRAESARRIAVERTEPQRIFALVRRVEQDVIRLVLHGHQQHRADTGLDILLRGVELPAADDRLEGVHHAGVYFRDGNYVVLDAEVLGQFLRIFDRMVGREL